MGPLRIEDCALGYGYNHDLVRGVYASGSGSVLCLMWVGEEGADI